MATRRIENPGGERASLIDFELPRMCWSGWAPLALPQEDVELQKRFLTTLADVAASQVAQLRAAAEALDNVPSEEDE